jgi:hypothetical protein
LKDWLEPDKSSGGGQTNRRRACAIGGRHSASPEKYTQFPPIRFPPHPALPLLNVMAMLGRRSDARFTMTQPTCGTLRVLRDVMVHRNGDEEWIALSREPAVAGETLLLDLVIVDVDETRVWDRFAVNVIESRPVIADGDMRYRIRLHSGEDPVVLFEQQIRRG